jgi:hypothetical protein
VGGQKNLHLSSKDFSPSILKVKSRGGGQEFWVFVMKLKYSLLSFLAYLQRDVTPIVVQKNTLLLLKPI